MRRDQLPPNRGATFVLPRWKVVYVSVSKAACTSIKWMLADLQGEDPERFYTAINREVSRALTIHTRPLWQHTPMLHELSDADLAEISPERGWFTFTATRHPAGRLWSAWQSKLLLRDPKWTARAGDASWFPRVPSSTEDVIEDFHRFVRAVDERQPGVDVVMSDRHFRPQTELAVADRMPYTRVYDIRQIPEMLDDLAAHLRGAGWDGSLKLRSTNDTPLRPLPATFTEEVTDAISRIYAADFEQLGYGPAAPDKFEPADEYGEGALREVARLVERNERIGDLARIASDLQAEQGANGGPRRSQLAGLRRPNGALVRRVRMRMLTALKRA
jgi:hypothetical protein